MKFKLCVGMALVSAIAVYGQSESAPSVDRSRVYIRRFSIGATANFFGLPTVKDNTATLTTTTPAVAGAYSTTGASPRFGYGLNAQVLVTSHIAVNASLFYHKIGYTMNSDRYLGVLDPNATVDNRTHVVTNEDTRARFYDLPVTIRYYFRNRYTPGAHFFAEGGASIRRVSNIKTSIDTTVNSGTTTCCDTTPISPARRTTRGVVAGLGAQFVDPFGIRVIPEVRYTRWQGKIFDNYATSMQANQLEVMLTIGF